MGAREAYSRNGYKPLKSQKLLLKYGFWTDRSETILNLMLAGF